MCLDIAAIYEDKAVDNGVLDTNSSCNDTELGYTRESTECWLLDCK